MSYVKSLDIKLVDYTAAMEEQLQLRDNLSVDTTWSRVAYVHGKFPKKGVAVVQGGRDTERASVLIRRALSARSVEEGCRLYVPSEVRTPRDLYRNSGYRITLDPDKADICATPALTRPFWRSCFNYITMKDGTLRLYTIFPPYPLRWNDLDEYETARISGTVPSFLVSRGETPAVDSAGMYTVEMMPAYTGYRKALEEDVDWRTFKYVDELKIPLYHATKITPEVLLTWANIRNDRKMLGALITGSDWQRYPMTVLLFLCHYAMGGAPLRDGRAVSLMLDTIGYDSAETSARMLRGRVIQPEDWNMWQRFQLLREGLGDKGGFVRNDDCSNKWLRSRMALAPMFIDRPMPYEELVAAVKNS